MARKALPGAGERADTAGRGFLVFWSVTKLLGGLIVVVGASVAIAWGAHRFALTTPRFAIKEIEVTGNRRFTPDRITTLADQKLGDNIFAVDLAAVEQRLLAEAWIYKARALRELPGTLKLEIVEREAAALLVLGSELFLVTSDGEPFKRHEDRDPSDLPVITGLTAEGLALDRRREMERLGVAMEVLRHYEHLSLSRAHAAEEVHLAADGTVVLTIGQGGALSDGARQHHAVALHLGRGPWRQKLFMAERVMNELRAKGQTPGIVFLDNERHTERVVARMR